MVEWRWDRGSIQRWVAKNSKFSVLVNIHSEDGSVLVQHGGVEMGQGINTKVGS